MGKYFYRNGQFLKITAVKGKYSLKYKSYLDGEEANFVFFGVGEFMMGVRPVTPMEQMKLYFARL
jgi:hypothetical protein